MTITCIIVIIVPLLIIITQFNMCKCISEKQLHWATRVTYELMSSLLFLLLLLLLLLLL